MGFLWTLVKGCALIFVGYSLAGVVGAIIGAALASQLGENE